MKIIIISIATLLILIIAFVMMGITAYKRHLKNDKYDLLTYLKKHKDKMSITIKENGIDTLAINSNQKFPLASTLKIIIAFNFVKAITNDRFSITEKVELDDINKFYIENTDGGAHPNWKKSIGYPKEVSLFEVAKGMMQFSCNTCTDFLIDKIGPDIINDSIKALQLNHDKISYLTPPILIPGYLSDKRSLAMEKLESMNQQSYQELSRHLFEKMNANKTVSLVEKAPKMLNGKMQLLMTNKMSSSTTKQYADLMLKLGNKLLTKKEKELFSEVVLGESVKGNSADYLWYKGGSTMFVLTFALYKEFQDNTTSVALFIKNDTGGELYWIRNILRDFVVSIALDIEFREKVKDQLS